MPSLFSIKTEDKKKSYSNLMKSRKIVNVEFVLINVDNVDRSSLHLYRSFRSIDLISSEFQIESMKNDHLHQVSLFLFSNSHSTKTKSNEMRFI